MAENPFVTHAVADVRIIEFRASQRADDARSGSRRADRAAPPLSLHQYRNSQLTFTKACRPTD